MIRSHVLVCGGTGCTSSGSQAIREKLAEELKIQGLDEEVKIVQTGCFGLCALGPIMIVYPEGTFYSQSNCRRYSRKSFPSTSSRVVSLNVLFTMKPATLTVKKKPLPHPLTKPRSTRSRSELRSVTAASSTPRTSTSTSQWTVTSHSLRF